MLTIYSIKPRQTEWASSIVFLHKKDGTLSFGSTTAKLKEVTIWDLYPTLHMDECIDFLGEATIFSTMHSDSGYWQVEIAEEHHEKTISRLILASSASPACLSD